MIYNYKGQQYPEYLKQGNAIKYILPYAEYFLHGDILDIGGTEKWHYPGAEWVNIENSDGFHAMNLPDKVYDGIISSHTLEHVKDPFYALKYWGSRLTENGCLFLYLPHQNMRYWSNDNPKHLHTFTPTQIKYWLQDLGYSSIIHSEQDMYWSFTVVGWKG